MKRDREEWLDKHAVFCRVFKGRWSIRHCLKIYCEIKDLKIEMAIRARGGVKRLQSTYNPCENCRVLATALKNIQSADSGVTVVIDGPSEEEKWAACG
jgi:hypothetical protein